MHAIKLPPWKPNIREIRVLIKISFKSTHIRVITVATSIIKSALLVSRERRECKLNEHMQVCVCVCERACCVQGRARVCASVYANVRDLLFSMVALKRAGYKNKIK